jgi:secreted trypsin-like serine protease
MVATHGPLRRPPAHWIGGAIVLVAALGAAPVAAQSAGDDAVVLHNTLPDHFQLGDGIVGYRIVGGFAAKPGAWPSMVVIHDRTFENGHTPFCGGTVIDREWVLTAGHCVFHRQAKNLFIRESVNTARSGGRLINVRQVVVNDTFEPYPPRNDVALLRLAAPADSPRQLLMGNAGAADLAKAGTLATIIGYGRMRPQPVAAPQNFNAGPASERLLEADLPLVSLETCRAAYNSRWITAATICAGREEGGVDSCNGDSGGPLFVRDELEEPVQAGIVSWGAGCAQASKFGIYASVGNFADWIRQHVPNASFVGERANGPPNATNGVLGAIVRGPATGNPSRLAQVSVDVLPGERVRVGEHITVRVTSSVPGNLMVFNQESDGRAYQVFPNRYSGRNLPGQARTAIAAGRSISIPGPMDGFRLTIAPPAGANRMIAVVVPANIAIDDLAGGHDDMQPIDDLDALLAGIFARVTRDLNVEAATPNNRAVGVRRYVIVE